jgi:hypothetical protein
MQYDLSDDYLAEARQRAYRYQGQWTGTAGALAADVARLLIERKRMEGTTVDLKETNSQLRAAVENRMAGRGSMPTPDQLFGGGCCDGGKVKAQSSANAYAERLSGDSLLDDQGDISPAERLLLDAIDVVRDRRPKYGGPRHHFRRTIGMINAAFADVLKRPLTESDWAIFMTFDKVARFLGPNKTADGPIDLAGYAACLAECESAEPD